ncbi:MAG: glycosyltransferase [Phycisphaerales bacterium]|nr:glycosyltransferase [Phycisphaerales bacterium]NNM27871.1 glycosyltransferase [Phycisphaerales bacterium]
MRILIVSPFFPPQHAVASLRAHSFAHAWADAGHDVSVLTTEKRADQAGLELAPVGFGVTAIPVPRRWGLEQLRGADHAEPETPSESSSPGWIRVLRAARGRTGVYSGLRMPDLTDAWVRPALAWAREQPPWDAVVSSSGPYTAHLVGLHLRREQHAGTWFADFRDLWTANHLASGLFPFTLRERSLEQQVFDDADAIVTVSDGLADRLRTAAATPVHVVYNGFATEEIASLNGARRLDEQHVHLAYTGTLYPRGQDPRPLLAGLARLRRDEPTLADRVRLVVAGTRADLWRAPARELGVESRLDVRGLVPRDEALRLQRDAHALVSIEWSQPYSGVLSGKLLEYLPWETPILVVGGPPDGSIARLVAEADRGDAVGSDPATIAAWIGRLARDPAACRRPGRPEVTDRYRRAAQAARLLRLLEAAVSNRPESGSRSLASASS